MADYQAEPATSAQSRCRHPRGYRTRAEECSICGSRKRGPRWEYLTKDCFHSYVDGKEAARD